MPKSLERDLGLFATITISIGAMVGSGIFVLPGLASKLAGPAVILAYLLAGLVVLPAALAKSEMATAMPESGGTYLFIDRAMGPAAGTIAGIGAWFSLVFKSAFALVGLGAYLLLFAPQLAGVVKPVALVLAVLLVGVNVVGVKQTGRMQAIIVSLVLLALLVFIGDGLTYVDQSQYHPFFATGPDGLLAATGFVFVSYAGVTKIASVAEEVEDPGRNIPMAILGSIGLMMLVYTFVVFVIVGVTPLADLAHSYTPMADAAGNFLGSAGVVGVSVIAVLALTSMANAGILSSSRYPLAMSRDRLAPSSLQSVHERYRTPIRSISLTGAVLLALIAFVPVVELAKLASAFQLLVFTLINVALVAFRESDLEGYEPEFVAPFYPWAQLFGIVGGVVLLTQMGTLPLLGAVGIVVASLLWYLGYARERTGREGAAVDAIRRTRGVTTADRTREALDSTGERVLVAVGSETDFNDQTTLLRMAAAVAARRNGEVEVARFEEVPDQTSLTSAAGEQTPAEAEFERRVEAFAADFDVSVTATEVVTHDLNHAVANHAEEFDVLFGEVEPDFGHEELLGDDVDWYIEHSPADLVFVRNRGLPESIDDVAVVADRGPFDPLEVVVADAVAAEHDARVRLIHALPGDASDDQIRSIGEYQNEVAELCESPVSTEIHRADDRLETIRVAVGDADLAVVGTSAHHLLYDVMFGALPDELAEELECTVALSHAREARRHTFIRYLLDRFVF
ncbi:amino acid permease [Halospeciosus flavus]|uniref:Amino acid permease n=1 Tax=Halospeciosus flavus TaxID=3032283 RepID=A0ABD5Z1B8_9EURY|nr:amino acid permease [Halospeciosus flavus]